MRLLRGIYYEIKDTNVIISRQVHFLGEFM